MLLLFEFRFFLNLVEGGIEGLFSCAVNESLSPRSMMDRMVRI